jgi:hypothetical protein
MLNIQKILSSSELGINFIDLPSFPLFQRSFPCAGLLRSILGLRLSRSGPRQIKAINHAPILNKLFSTLPPRFLVKFPADSFKIHNPYSPDQLKQSFRQLEILDPHARAFTTARSPSSRSGTALAAAGILVSLPPDGSSCLNRARKVSSRFQAKIKAMLMHCAQKAPALQASALETSRFCPKASSLPLGPN